ncbi:HEAT repeat domain-containing protein [Streptomyces sp. WMMC940]|uniref:HEAT repeat domain-containing protein n=1 Tax=Streptomyces sp. WMMC940 TaxID=3015153 RepID=UPI0022B73EAD|nr:HEAT repeat domain-containing protein [Streptomyces sp. WMMC940]MCZ7458005.1 HEAT repeat domain-containing protein [Streptomyces sp. WMMC940]
MFTGMDEVDWASMGHAYGPADDVPGLLRALASADPAERESALDGMYTAVHHQGDVYDSTLACIPFLLELVASPEVQDRGAIVELLTSIGGIDLDDDELDPEDEEFEDAANYAMAAAAVAAGADVFVGLLGDPDAGVRLAAPCALAMLHGDPARVLALLRDRLEGERDTEVRLALVEAVGRIALRHEPLRAESVNWLTTLLAPHRPPGLRLSALTQLARCAPGLLPDDVASTATALLRATDEAAACSAAGSGPGAGSRAEAAGGDGGPGAPWADDLLRTLHSALGDRVDDRIALLTGQLTSADPDQRTDAVWMCHGLIRAWRGPYDEVVRLVGAQLDDPDPLLHGAAASLLESLFGLALPAADALAERVRTADGERPADRRALVALARLGDARAVPALARALEQPDPPRDAAFAVPYLGDRAAPLVPVLRRRLGEVALDEQLYDRAAPLLTGIAGVRAAEALPEVLRVLRGAPAPGGEWVTEAALRALTTFGTAALPAAPELRGLLGGASSRPSSSVVAAAARALWAATGDAAAVLPVLRELLTADGPDERRAAAAALGAIGRPAADAAPALRDLLASPERWLRMDAAVALWRVTGEARESLPVLRTAWEENRYGRVEIAECLAEMGPSAGPAAPLLRAELARPRRHNVLDGGSGSHDIEQDERLLTLCRAALRPRA